MQVYSVYESSIAIRKNNKFIIWGSNASNIIGKDTRKEKKDNNVMDSYTGKDEFTDIVNTTLIKESQDYTDAFIKSRKLFNTQFNQVKRDNMLKRIEINSLETKKFSLIDDNARVINAKHVKK
jgi:hypothetical protein